MVYAAELFAAAVARDPTTPTAPGPAAAERANARLLQELARLLARTLDQSAWADKSRPLDAIGELVQPLWRAQLTVAEARAWLVALGRIDRPPKQG